MQIALIDKLHPAFEEAMKKAQVECIDLVQTDIEALPNALEGVNGIAIRSRISITAEFLDKVPSLKFIARSGAGMEHIDQDACEERGIICYNSPEGNSQAVAEHALGMLLALMNRLHLADHSVRSGAWEREKHRGHELSGKTVGIIGYGLTGSAFARVISGFGVRILANDKYLSGFGNETVKEASVSEIQKQADVLSFHTPLTEDTEQMVNQRFIDGFAKPFWFINTARGKIVNTADLLSAMDNGKVLGACLDVLEYEKQSFQEIAAPDTLKQAWDHPDIIFSPHIAGWTFESKRKLAEILAEKIITDYEDGRFD